MGSFNWFKPRDGKDVAQVSTIEALDALLNMGDSIFDNSLVSPSMRRFLDAYNLGTSAMRRGNLAEAIDVFRQLIAKEPRFVAPRVNLANCLLFSSRPHEALQELDHARRLAPRDIDIYMLMARIYDSLGDSENEIQQYCRILEIDPYHVLALINLGATFRLKSQCDLAEQYLTRALEQIEKGKRLATVFGQMDNSQEQIAQHNLALTYEAKGEWSKAVQCWKRCVESAPDNDQFCQRLQKAEEKQYMQDTVQPLRLKDGRLAAPIGYKLQLVNGGASIGPFDDPVHESEWLSMLQVGWKWQLVKAQE